MFRIVKFTQECAQCMVHRMLSQNQLWSDRYGDSRWNEGVPATNLEVVDHWKERPSMVLPLHDSRTIGSIISPQNLVFCHSNSFFLPLSQQCRLIQAIPYWFININLKFVIKVIFKMYRIRRRRIFTKIKNFIRQYFLASYTLITFHRHFAKHDANSKTGWNDFYTLIVFHTIFSISTVFHKISLTFRTKTILRETAWNKKRKKCVSRTTWNNVKNLHTCRILCFAVYRNKRVAGFNIHSQVF